MKTKLAKFSMAIVGCITLPVLSLISVRAQAAEALPAKMQKVQAMHLVTQNTGWVAGRKNLMLTQDAGQHWTDITPPAKTAGNIKSVFFLNATEGWVATSFAGTVIQVSPSFAISRTSDAGATWKTEPLTASFEAGSTPVSLDFVDTLHGWLMLRAPSSPNFSRGVLLATTDGGASWKALPTPPIGGEVRFTSSSVGWVAGGPAGNQLYVTRDGGQSWQQQSVAAPAGVTAETTPKYQLPKFSNDREGTLAVFFGKSETSKLVVYGTKDGGTTWGEVNAVSVGSDAHRAATSVVDANTFFVAPSNREGFTTASKGVQNKNAEFFNKLAPYEAVTALEFADERNGWVLVDGGHCAAGKTQCSQQSTLLATSDGGQTVKDVTPLLATSDAVPTPKDPILPLTVSPATVGTFTSDELGFDMCEAGTVSQMQAWWSNTPWSFANIYIGGDQRGCSQPTLNSAWVSDIIAQGWALVPTWVGPQAPTTSCSSCSIRISTNLAEAEEQGKEQADEASTAANLLGLIAPTIIYYDMEEYSGSSPEVKAFMEGWRIELHNVGNKAGGYGAPANQGTDWANAASAPDDIWIADWNGSTSVYGISGLPDTDWDHNQRLHQYEGGHDETWGGVTFNIDSNSADGQVAY